MRFGLRYFSDFKCISKLKKTVVWSLLGGWSEPKWLRISLDTGFWTPLSSFQCPLFGFQCSVSGFRDSFVVFGLHFLASGRFSVDFGSSLITISDTVAGSSEHPRYRRMQRLEGSWKQKGTPRSSNTTSTRETRKDTPWSPIAALSA